MRGFGRLWSGGDVRAGRALLAMDLANVSTAGPIAIGLDDPHELAHSPAPVSVLER